MTGDPRGRGASRAGRELVGARLGRRLGSFEAAALLAVVAMAPRRGRGVRLGCGRWRAVAAAFPQVEVLCALLAVVAAVSLRPRTVRLLRLLLWRRRRSSALGDVPVVGGKVVVVEEVFCRLIAQQLGELPAGMVLRVSLGGGGVVAKPCLVLKRNEKFRK